MRVMRGEGAAGKAREMIGFRAGSNLNCSITIIMMKLRVDIFSLRERFDPDCCATGSLKHVHAKGQPNRFSEKVAQPRASIMRLEECLIGNLYKKWRSTRVLNVSPPQLLARTGEWRFQAKVV